MQLQELVPIVDVLLHDPLDNWRIDKGFITQKVLIKLFCKSQFPHKSVNLFFIITDSTNKLTDLYGN